MLRVLPQGLAAVLVVFALAGCGGDDSGDVSVPTAPTSTPSTQAAPPTTTTAPPTTSSTESTETSGGTGATTTEDSGGTSAPGGGSDDQQSANDRFKRYCDENPGACGE